LAASCKSTIDLGLLAAMREAADLGGKSETHDTLSPGPIGFTAHEALGELLLKQGQPAKVLAAFEESLQLAANRPRSYYGAALSANKLTSPRRRRFMSGSSRRFAVSTRRRMERS